MVGKVEDVAPQVIAEGSPVADGMHRAREIMQAAEGIGGIAADRVARALGFSDGKDARLFLGADRDLPTGLVKLGPGDSLPPADPFKLTRVSAPAARLAALGRTAEDVHAGFRKGVPADVALWIELTAPGMAFARGARNRSRKGIV